MSFDPTDKSNYCIGKQKNDEIDAWLAEAMKGAPVQGKEAWCEYRENLIDQFLEYMGEDEIKDINLADYEERAHKFFE